MSCVINRLHKSLPNHYITHCGIELKEDLVDYIKQHNKTPSKHITINDKVLKLKFRKECKMAIDNLDNMTNGYYCSTADPLLIIYCELFRVSITHNYNGNIIKYKNTKYPNNIIKLKSNNSHMF